MFLLDASFACMVGVQRGREKRKRVARSAMGGAIRKNINLEESGVIKKIALLSEQFSETRERRSWKTVSFEELIMSSDK